MEEPDWAYLAHWFPLAGKDADILLLSRLHGQVTIPAALAVHAVAVELAAEAANLVGT